MNFSEYITEGEMQILLRKKLELEKKLDKTKRNSNRQKILDELKEISDLIQTKYGAINTIKESADTAKLACHILEDNGIISDFIKAWGKPLKFAQCTYGRKGNTEYVNIHAIISDGVGLSDSAYNRILKVLEPKYLPILKKEGIDGKFKVEHQAIRFLI